MDMFLRSKHLNLNKEYFWVFLTSKHFCLRLGSNNCPTPVKELEKVTFIDNNTIMNTNLLLPPQNLHGMKVLDKEAFKKDVSVLALEIKDADMRDLKTILKKYFLRCCNLKPIQSTENQNVKFVLFNPELVQKVTDFDDFVQKNFEKLGISQDKFKNKIITLNYDNWNAEQILKAVLPANEPPLTSYSIIGHIIHLNIKMHLLDYKNIIGQVLLEKVPCAKTVVNKTNRIESVYRNFEMELICGEPNFVVTAKENGCTFQFDFSVVYWNPRLGTEHLRIIELLQPGDVLFDVFCGVGPFAVPAAKKKCMVYANDLNPDSFKWLQTNIKLNKVNCDYIHTFHKDASDFIHTDVKRELIALWKNKLFNGKIVVVMNLPALAATFVKCFKGLLILDINNLETEHVKNHLPIVHCYIFASDLCDAQNIIEQKANIKLSAINEHSIYFVRNVSATKNMYRVKFKLPLEYLTSNLNSNHSMENKRISLSEEPGAKRFCKSD